MSFTFHRAFRLVFRHLVVVTTPYPSERRPTANKRLREQRTAGHVSDMPLCREGKGGEVEPDRDGGGGITQDNIMMVLESTGVNELHGSFKAAVDSGAKSTLAQAPGDRSEQKPNEEKAKSAIIQQNRAVTSKKKLKAALRAIGYGSTDRTASKTTENERMVFVSTSTDTCANALNVELLLLRNRENLVKKREEELQRLCKRT